MRLVANTIDFIKRFRVVYRRPRRNLGIYLLGYLFKYWMKKYVKRVYISGLVSEMKWNVFKSYLNSFNQSTTHVHSFSFFKTIIVSFTKFDVCTFSSKLWMFFFTLCLLTFTYKNLILNLPSLSQYPNTL